MADLEAVLADVSYLMAMEKSKSTPAARASKKIVLPDPRFVLWCFYFARLSVGTEESVAVLVGRVGRVCCYRR